MEVEVVSDSTESEIYCKSTTVFVLAQKAFLMGYFSEGVDVGILSKNDHNCKTCWDYFAGNVISGKLIFRKEHCQCTDK